ncbi:FHA domain-containing protein [Janibacter terrae]|jgi:pSer/pThr/pTyr-binding forkhead associated (FHA) protein|uniref:FHA domain-containing protein n=1 Tax=Janibacter terrae TaxID=103817 RepID=A0ABZ2FFJ9_9MICO|nr:FHA domain-containing protein [Janibacter terrae]MBA4085179.1 FHA domain-containing protein [Kytococcus sp.]HCE59853.1 FHA domain-containing protein [Janibacter terrae]
MNGDDQERPGRQDPATQQFTGIGANVPGDISESDYHLTRDEQATVDALHPGTALLIVLRGPNTGARFLLDDAEVTTGRGPESDIFLDDVTVSRKHAVFSREEHGFGVRDVGSLNGTYVNKERIDQTALRTGDEVQIGKFRLVYYASSAA